MLKSLKLSLAIKFCIFSLSFGHANVAVAQNNIITLEGSVSGGIFEPIKVALPDFIIRSGINYGFMKDLLTVLERDLENTGLFKKINRNAYLSKVSEFDAPIQFSDWSLINASVLLTAELEKTGPDEFEIKFRIWDVISQSKLGKGLKFTSKTANWRRVAHKVADEIYNRVTGEGPYFDSKIVFVAESGPKNKRIKRIAVMDQDGANVRFLTDGKNIVIKPMFSPSSDSILYTSYKSGVPRVYKKDLKTGKESTFKSLPGMNFSPRFSPDGKNFLLSITSKMNTDIYKVSLSNGKKTRLTDDRAIDTAPSFSPDGKLIVFESDRSSTQQLYVMRSNGSGVKRITFGKGRYGEPAWSPRGDLIAFTKMADGYFYIGVIKPDGTGEKILTKSSKDQAPTWSPHGRVIMFYRETLGARGAPHIYMIDVTGANLRKMKTGSYFASDPSWSSLLN